MNLGILVSHFEPGGIGNRIFESVKYLRKNFDVTVLCKDVKFNKSILEKAGVEVVTKDRKSFYTVLNKMDIIDSHSPFLSQEIIHKRKPFIFTYHGICPAKFHKFFEYSPKLFFSLTLSYYVLMPYALKRVFKSARGIISISRYIEEEVLRKWNRKSVIIGNPIKEIFFQRKIHKKDFNELSILYVGVPTYRKGIFDLLRLAKFLKKMYKNAFKLHVVGPYQEKMKKRMFTLIKRLGLQDAIKIYGWVDDKKLIELYDSSNIFVQPSYWESFSIPLIEAMSRGTPVIGRNVGAIKEHITNSQSGLLFSSIEEVPELIEKVFDNYDYYSRNGRKYAKKFHPKIIAKKLKETYLSVFNKEM